MRDDPQRALHNTCAGTVIHIQKDFICLRIILLEPHHDTRAGSPETIDGLVVIPNRKNVVRWSRQHPYGIILRPVDVLKFVNQNVPKPLPPFFQYISPLLKQAAAQNEHVLKINLSEFFLFRLVSQIDFPENLSVKLPGFVALYLLPVIFYISNLF